MKKPFYFVWEKPKSEKPAEKGRDPYFDNARFLLVALVVLGHLLSPVRESSEALYFANNFLASFRMPALILITGYFTKHIWKDKERFVKRLVLGILFPYVVFQSFYLWMLGLVQTLPELAANLFAPSFGMWFLLSLLFWNLLLLPFSKLKHPILVSAVIALAIGWVDGAGEFLSLSRTFVFLPLFLMGHYAKKEQLDWFKSWKAKVVSLFSAAASLLLLSAFSLDQARDALLARHPYVQVADSMLEGTWLRLVFYLIMFLGILAFLPWVPRRKWFFTYLGRRTAYVYVLHLFFINLFTLLELFPKELGWSIYLALPVVWLAIVFLVSSTPVVFLAKPIVEGKITVPALREWSFGIKLFGHSGNLADKK